jgi:hypothetical protein
MLRTPKGRRKLKAHLVEQKQFDPRGTLVWSVFQVRAAGLTLQPSPDGGASARSGTQSQR